MSINNVKRFNEEIARVRYTPEKTNDLDFKDSGEIGQWA